MKDYKSLLELVYEQITNPRQPSYFNASFHFVETAPQHFGSQANGYFAAHDDERVDLRVDQSQQAHQCTDWGEDSFGRNMTAVRGADWRNVMMREVLGPSKWNIVPLAQPLYSQHDAHQGWAHSFNARNALFDNYTLMTEDCTHWCMSSGVGSYMQTVIFNHLRQDFSKNNRKPGSILSGYLPQRAVGEPQSRLKNLTPISEPGNYGNEIFALIDKKMHRLKHGIFTFEALPWDPIEIVRLPAEDFNSIPWGRDVSCFCREYPSDCDCSMEPENELKERKEGGEEGKNERRLRA